MGLTAGPVPARVPGPAKRELVALAAHATGAGFSLRWACRQLGVDHARLLGWKVRVGAGQDLQDRVPGTQPGSLSRCLCN